jgi:histidinol phosphatase-like enzyme (inositol monophosphatase family)
MTEQTLMDAALEAAELAGAIALARFKTPVGVDDKPDGSPVTEADRAAEQAVRAWVARRFPGDPVFGEEFGGECRDDDVRRWVVDPIDGTKAFIRGVPLWGTLVAVAVGRRIIAGAAAYPALAETLAAAPGQGCWWNGARCRVSETADLANAVILTTDVRYQDNLSRRDGWRALVEQVRMARTWGDAYGYCLVATGRADVMIDPVMNPWDCAPFLPIIAEAGGVVTDWSGLVTAFGGSLIATNAALAAPARVALGAGAP